MDYGSRPQVMQAYRMSADIQHASADCCVLTVSLMPESLLKTMARWPPSTLNRLFEAPHTAAPPSNNTLARPPTALPEGMRPAALRMLSMSALFQRCASQGVASRGPDTAFPGLDVLPLAGCLQSSFDATVTQYRRSDELNSCALMRAVVKVG